MPERLPITKLFDTPFISLDETNVEMASILFLFVAVLAIAGIRRRRQLVRHVVQGVSVLFFFYVVYSCLGVFGMIRNGLYGLTLLGSAYTESFYWMALPVVVLATTVFAGPVFCGWICPTGTIQELLAGLRTRLLHGRRPATRGQLAGLALVTALFFGGLVWMSARQQLFVEDSSLHWAGSLLLLCLLVLLGVIEDRPTRALRLLSLLAIFVTAASHLSITSPVHFAFTARGDPASMVSTVVIAVASLFVSRSFCRYLCPWGYLSGVLHRFSRLRVVHQVAACDGCATCDRVCDVAAIEKGVVTTELCQMCYACVDHCPRSALEVQDVWRTRADADVAAVHQPDRAHGARAG
ncbi:MAG: 4Fe-4S binding protein [Pseudomonadota bacterium]